MSEDVKTKREEWREHLVQNADKGPPDALEWLNRMSDEDVAVTNCVAIAEVAHTQKIVAVIERLLGVTHMEATLLLVARDINAIHQTLGAINHNIGFVYGRLHGGADGDEWKGGR